MHKLGLLCFYESSLRTVGFEDGQQYTLTLSSKTDAATAVKSPNPVVPSQPIVRNQRVEQDFNMRLQLGIQHFRSYMNPELMQIALQQIPLAELKMKACESMATNTDKASIQDDHGQDDELHLLAQLLKWFKGTYFKWVDRPPCDFCGTSNKDLICPIGGSYPNDEEKKGRPGIVELYKCETCGNVTRFPRYNDVSILMKTRRGRCGEWANCFSLFCLAAGFETRHIMDWTDHVWTEVWSPSLKRWIHCDSCEEKYDCPLLYEKGWGKKLNYVIAFGSDHITDVTSRYTDDWTALSQRRTLVSEDWLQKIIEAYNEQFVNGLDDSMIGIWCDRREQESVYLKSRTQPQLDRLLMSENTNNGRKDSENDGMEGRISGSKEWKEIRGETGNPPSNSKGS